jgi:hypothetical protein
VKDMMRRIVAEQMAAALAAATRDGSFDSVAFVERMLSDDPPPVLLPADPAASPVPAVG